jgi:ribose transport system ATP-binding protein
VKQGFRGWVPLALMVLLMVVIGAYTQTKESSFLSSFSLNGLFIAAIPLALAAMGQTNALMVRCFDVSIGALITLAVVIASFTIPDPSSLGGVLLGMLAVIGVCLVVGLGNIVLTKVLGLSSIIATLATYSILTGVALWLRPTPDGSISLDFADFMLSSVGFLPVGFIAVVVVAIAGDVWLYRSGGGLSTRSVGLDETSAARLGAKVGWVFVRALIISSLAAAAASFFLSAQVLVGDPNVGLAYTLTSIAAAVLGGASLAGGRGSYIGAVIGAVFLTEIVVIVPFLGLHSSWAQMLVGGLTLLALAFYQAPQILGRVRASRGEPGAAPPTRTQAPPAQAPVA